MTRLILTALIASLALNFSQPVPLTALTLQKGDEKAQTLGPLPELAGAAARIALPKLAPGIYLVSWRALSKDNHVMSGQFRFTLSSSQASEHSGQHH